MRIEEVVNNNETAPKMDAASANISYVNYKKRDVTSITLGDIEYFDCEGLFDEKLS